MFREPDPMDHFILQNNYKTELAREEFLNVTNAKILNTKINREFTKYKLLFDINLEERRNNLRKLLEKEEQELVDEYFAGLETVESRKNKLLERAIKIRKDMELERQEIVKEKQEIAFKLKSEEMRGIHTKLHTQEIVKDWEKLKKYKDRLKREEYCEGKFWPVKEDERLEKLFESSILNRKKWDDTAKECFNENKKRMQENFQKKDDYLKEVQESAKISEQVMKILKEEDEEKIRQKHIKQNEYRKILDEQLKIKECIQSIYPKMEKSHDKIMIGENIIKLVQQGESNQTKKENLKKSFLDHIHHQNCIQKQLKCEENYIEKEEIKIGRQLDKKRAKLEYEKLKRYKDLCTEIQMFQKHQLKVAEEKKIKEKEEKMFYQKQFKKNYEDGLAKDLKKSEERQKLIDDHHKDLVSQIKFNDCLKINQYLQKMRDRVEGQMAEKQYLETLQEIKNKEGLLFKHPWRVNES